MKWSVDKNGNLIRNKTEVKIVEKEKVVTKVSKCKCKKEISELKKIIKKLEKENTKLKSSLLNNNCEIRQEGARVRNRRKFYDVRSGRVSDRGCIEFMGCTLKEFKSHIEKMFTDGMSWENHGEWEYDHIIPLSSFNLLDSEQRAKCNHYTNIQPLWKKDNLSKGVI